MSEAVLWPSRLFATARGRGAAPVADRDGLLAAPLVAILCTAPRARTAASAVALALARATGRPCALAGAVGADAGLVLGGLPAAQRTSAALRRRALAASATGRLAWLADRRGALLVDADDMPARCAALSAELGRSAGATGLPAAVAFPVARTAALDRVLAWHDAIVVVREPEAPATLVEHALTSLTALGRPVAAMGLPARLAASLAAAGLAVPAEATAVVRELARGGARPESRDA